MLNIDQSQTQQHDALEGHSLVLVQSQVLGALIGRYTRDIPIKHERLISPFRTTINMGVSGNDVLNTNSRHLRCCGYILNLSLMVLK